MHCSHLEVFLVIRRTTLYERCYDVVMTLFLFCVCYMDRKPFFPFIINFMISNCFGFQCPILYSALPTGTRPQNDVVWTLKRRQNVKIRSIQRPYSVVLRSSGCMLWASNPTVTRRQNNVILLF